MNAPPPALFRVTYRRGHCRGSFTSFSAQDVETVAAAYRASGFEVDIAPVAHDMPDGLRPLDDERQAA